MLKIYNAHSNCCTNPLVVHFLLDKYSFDEYDIGMHKVGNTGGKQFSPAKICEKINSKHFCT